MLRLAERPVRTVFLFAAMSAALSATLSQAKLLAAQGDDAQALACLDVALQVAPGSADPAPLVGQRRTLAEAHNLRFALLLRNERHLDALLAAEPALRQVDADELGAERARLLASVGYCFVQFSLPEHALRCASTAFALATRHSDALAAARGLESVGICYSLLGDCPLGEYFLLEALGTVLQTGDEHAILVRLSNAIHLSCLLYDAYSAAHDEERAHVALDRCLRFAAQGNRLLAYVGAWARCLFRSNRAGWLRRRGEFEKAEADHAAVHAEALAHGWSVIERFASYELALAARRRDDSMAALALLQSIPTGREDALNSFDISLRAHRLMISMQHAQGDAAAAQRHEAACADLLQRRAALRDDIAQRFSSLAEVAMQALDDVERARIAAEIGRLRGLADAPVARLFDLDTPAPEALP